MADTHRKRVLLAPLSGVMLPLERVPDPVFARKMVGEGIAIMPSGNILLAPCDGVVTQLHAASHALTLTTADGLQVFLHIGIETVGLNGRGFSAKVAPGDAVRTGDALIEFDLPYLARSVPSTASMMIIANGEMVERCLPASGAVEAGISPALELLCRQAPENAPPIAAAGNAQSSPIPVHNPSGLHARPAAVLAGRAKRFASEIFLFKGEDTPGRGANAKSLTSIMTLDVRHGDRVVLRACGPDAEEAVAVLAPLVESGLGESVFARQSAPPETPATAPAGSGRALAGAPAEGGDRAFFGAPASPGLACGVVFQLRESAAQAVKEGTGRDNEQRAFSAALRAARAELETLREQLREKDDSGKAAIFAAHAELLDDPELLRAALRGMDAGQSAAFAWQAAFDARAEMLGGLDNALLAERAGDIRDVGRRVLALLTGRPRRDNTDLPPNAIAVAEEFTPSEIAELDAARVQGLCATGGSATSHASLVARALGIPAVAALDARALSIPNGTPALLDGESGVLRLDPGEEDLRRARSLQEQRAAIHERELADAPAPAVTADGHRIAVTANIGGVEEAEKAVRQGGEGVGLLRSEFLFLNRADAPPEQEQAEAYQAIARILGPERALVARTLDAGGDKPLACLPLPAESNPFLGMRGIRLNMLDTGLFVTQVRAMLGAAHLTRLRIMFPMVASAEELRRAKGIVEAQKAALGVTAPVAVGIMVEVPSAALLAENLACEADFFSIGTNDLAQYTLAMDRGHPLLAGLADGLHPAVLRLVAATVEGARKLNKPVCVCGGLASDPEAVPVLMGLGVDELSVNVGSIPAVKSLIRKQNLERCKTLAADALTMLTATEVREYLTVFSTT